MSNLTVLHDTHTERGLREIFSFVLIDMNTTRRWHFLLFDLPMLVCYSSMRWLSYVIDDTLTMGIAYYTIHTFLFLSDEVWVVNWLVGIVAQVVVVLCSWVTAVAYELAVATDTLWQIAYGNTLWLIHHSFIAYVITALLISELNWRLASNSNFWSIRYKYTLLYEKELRKTERERDHMYEIQKTLYESYTKYRIRTEITNEFIWILSGRKFAFITSCMLWITLTTTFYFGIWMRWICKGVVAGDFHGYYSKCNLSDYHINFFETRLGTFIEDLCNTIGININAELIGRRYKSNNIKRKLIESDRTMVWQNNKPLFLDDMKSVLGIAAHQASNCFCPSNGMVLYPHSYLCYYLDTVAKFIELNIIQLFYVRNYSCAKLNFRDRNRHHWKYTQYNFYLHYCDMKTYGWKSVWILLLRKLLGELDYRHDRLSVRKRTWMDVLLGITYRTYLIYSQRIHINNNFIESARYQFEPTKLHIGWYSGTLPRWRYNLYRAMLHYATVGLVSFPGIWVAIADKYTCYSVTVLLIIIWIIKYCIIYTWNRYLQSQVKLSDLLDTSNIIELNNSAWMIECAEWNF